MQTTKKATKVARKANKQTKVSKGKAATPVASKPKMQLPPARVQQAKKLIAKLNTPNQLQQPGLIKQILQLYTNGYSCAEIIAYGFNKSTVYRQTRALNVLKQANAKKQLTAKGVQMLTGKNA